MTLPTPADTRVERETLARDALIVTVCTLISRLTGFARVLVAAAVLSNGVLGDTYHAANVVPNLLFELVAGGVLQAVLVPTFVAARRAGGDEQLGRTAGVLVSVITAGLAVLVAIGLAVSPLIARALAAAEPDSSVQGDKVDLITPMLLVFIPQVLFYGLGMVASAALAAKRRFAAAALAPAVNNVVVITAYVLFWVARDGEAPSLDLTPLQFVLVAGGTTLAVAAFTAIPAIVLTAGGVRWRPRWDLRDPAVATLRGSFGWAMLSVVGTLLPTAAAIVLGYGAHGGVAVFTMAFAFFVLPHALIAVPIATATAPRIAEAAQAGRSAQVAALVRRSAQVVVPTLLLAGAAMATLAWPIARTAVFGDAGSQGLAPIAHTLAVFGPGLLGYGMAFVLTRILFSLGDVRRTAILVSVAAVVGVGSMVVASALFPDGDRSTALALGFGITQLLSATLLTVRTRVLTGAPTWTFAAELGGGAVVAAVAAGGVMLVVQAVFGEDRWSSVAAIVVAGAAGVVTFLAVLRLTGGPRWTTLVRRGADAI